MSEEEEWIDEELADVLKRAEASGRYMVAVWKVEENKLSLFRQTHQFPRADFEGAVQLLRDDLEREPS